MKHKNITLFLSLFILCACEENNNFSAGVGIGGSGTGTTIPITVTPLPTKDLDHDDEINYIIWSNDKTESMCGNAKISMQLLHSQTDQPLERGFGNLISMPTTTKPTNVSIEIKIENLSYEPIYEYLNECQPGIKLFSEEMKYQNNQKFTCPNDSFLISYDSLQVKTYKFSFAVPYKESKSIISYSPDLSFGAKVPKDERLTCEPLTYEINVEKY